MKNTVDKDKFQTKIDENRDLLVPLAILFLAVVLFIVFILPSLFSFGSKKSERDTEVSKLNQIKEAKRVLENTDENVLDQEVELTSNALPSDRNFELILSAITDSAVRANVQIANYLFGDAGNTAGQNAYSELVFEIGILGGIDQAAAFANEITNTFPLSEVKGISHTNSISKILVSFYYKPFTSVDAQDAALAREKNPNEIEALEIIRQWTAVNPEPEVIDLVPEATQSAGTIEFVAPPDEDEEPTEP